MPLPVALNRPVYMSHALDYKNNIGNMFPLLDPRTLPEPEKACRSLPGRLREAMLSTEDSGKRMLDGLPQSSWSLVHPWNTDQSHAQVTPELTALLTVRNPVATAAIEQLEEKDLRVLETEPLVQDCLCAGRNRVATHNLATQ